MSEIKEYLNKGKRLILLNDKLPAHKDWPNRKLSDKEIKNHKGNFGWALSESDLVIDIDPRNGGDKSFAQFVEDFNFRPGPTVHTARGGFHIYMEIPKKFRAFKFKKHDKDYPGIDFLTKGAYVVISGSVTKDGTYSWEDDLFGFDQQTTDVESVLSYIKRGDVHERDSEDDPFAEVSNYDWSEEDVEKFLNKLDHNIPNDEWVKVGHALYNWHQQDGLALWEKWSLGGHTYKEGETAGRWATFKNLVGGVTLGSLIYMAKEADFDNHEVVTRRFVEQIKTSDINKIELTLIPKIKKADLPSINKERIIWAIQDKMKEEYGKQPPIGNIRDMVSGTTSKDLDAYVEETDWYKDWIYVANRSSYFNSKSFTFHKTESFNIKNGLYVPETRNGTKQRASAFVADNGLISVVDSTAYLPWKDELVCSTANGQILNIFNRNTVPTAARELTDEGKNIVNRIRKHFNILLGEKDTELLIQWMCHIIQYPGKKIRWIPLLQSIEGMGKGLIIEFFVQCLGSSNVGRVQPSQIASDFNSWATNKIMIILEEINIKGHNRYEAMNALKTIISEDYIQINEKGVPQYEVPNTANLIAFTNFKDSVPVSDTDRRYWMKSINIFSIEELEEIIGMDHERYFRELFDDLRQYGSEVRKWALDYTLTDVINKQQRAPMTDFKKYMISTEENNTVGLVEVKDFIKEGGKYFNEDCVSSVDLFEDLMMDNPEMMFNSAVKNKILKKLNYMAVPGVVKIDGKTRRIWVKKPMSNKEIRDCLNDYYLEVTDI